MASIRNKSSRKGKNLLKGSSNVTRKIDTKLAREKALKEKTLEVLFLGKPDSGKTTLLKSILHSKRIKSTSTEIKDSLDKVQYLLIRNFMKELVKFAQQLNLEEEEYSTKATDAILYLRDYIHLNKSTFLKAEVVDSIRSLWSEKSFQQTQHTHFNRFASFVQKLVEDYPNFGGEGWKLSQEEFVLVRDAYMGVETTQVNVLGDFFMSLVDVGGQKVTEQRKWLPMFESYRTVCYMIDVSTFDEMDPDYPEQNKVIKAVNEFKQILQKGLLTHASFFVVLTKSDLMRKKLESGISLNQTGKFHDYPENLSTEDSIQWFIGKIYDVVSEINEKGESKKIIKNNISFLDVTINEKMFTVSVDCVNVADCEESFLKVFNFIKASVARKYEKSWISSYTL